MRVILSLGLIVLMFAALPATARPRVQSSALTPEAINTAQLSAGRAGPATILKVQVLLDRTGFSPGVIDGHGGDNFDKAVRAFQEASGLNPSGKLDKSTFEALSATSAGDIVRSYAITEADLKGPFIDRLPHDFRDMARLKRIAYLSPRELLAERFHASEELLEALNRGRDFKKAGTEIVIPAVTALDDAKAQANGRRSRRKTADASEGETVRVEVNKTERSVRVYAADGTLAAFYPASIGSAEKPAPSGTFEVRRVTPDPTYRYDPAYAFTGQTATKPVEIAPGPNSPVGTVWIALSADSYGLHGTPEPDKIGKTASHGCVRLTNWDALALASLVKKGTPVAFID